MWICDEVHRCTEISFLQYLLKEAWSANLQWLVDPCNSCQRIVYAGHAFCVMEDISLAPQHKHRPVSHPYIWPSIHPSINQSIHHSLNKHARDRFLKRLVHINVSSSTWTTQYKLPFHFECRWIRILLYCKILNKASTRKLTLRNTGNDWGEWLRAFILDALTHAALCRLTNRQTTLIHVHVLMFQRCF